MAESCFFLHKISRGNKTSPRCLDGWTIFKWYWEYAGKAMFFDKSATKKVLFLNLICNGIQMILTVIFGVLVCCILMPNSIIQTRTAALLFVTLSLVAFFLKKFIIKGYSIEKLLHKINEYLSPFISILAVFRYLIFRINTIFCF
jgi:glucan phosphoethanolaminetransferase (alkaline phosphatase superfamily)